MINQTVKILIAGLLSSAIFLNEASARTVLLEPSADDPTSEFPVYLLNGFNGAAGHKFYEYLTDNAVEAYVFDISDIPADKVSAVIPDGQVSEERIFLMSFGCPVAVPGRCVALYLYEADISPEDVSVFTVAISNIAAALVIDDDSSVKILTPDNYAEVVEDFDSLADDPAVAWLLEPAGN